MNVDDPYFYKVDLNHPSIAIVFISSLFFHW